MSVLEICVDSVESAMAAEQGGADRVELCSDLLEGGITPSAGLISIVREKISIPMFVMIRPRGGDFCYTSHELCLMRADIRHAISAGADGLVLGILDRRAEVDTDRTRELVEAADPLPVTFHRAVDMSAAPVASIERIISAGAGRVLTSGGRMRSIDGVKVIREMLRLASGRIRVMVGGGVNAGSIRKIAEATGAPEFHARLSRRVQAPVCRRRGGLFLGSDPERDQSRFIVREQDVRVLREQLRQVDGDRAIAGAC